MHFDEIHTRLLAVAKKGTQDEFFTPGSAASFHSNSKISSARTLDSGMAGIFLKNSIKRSERILKNSKNLQLTLFDLP